MSTEPSNMAVTTVATASMASSDKASPEPAQQVREWRVLSYAFGWNSRRNAGRVGLSLENYNGPAVVINVSQPQEFAGYVAILKEPRVFYNSLGWLHTGIEPMT
jgi:hypothetical protein